MPSISISRKISEYPTSHGNLVFSSKKLVSPSQDSHIGITLDDRMRLVSISYVTPLGTTSKGVDGSFSLFQGPMSSGVNGRGQMTFSLTSPPTSGVTYSVSISMNPAQMSNIAITAVTLYFLQRPLVLIPIY